MMICYKYTLEIRPKFYQTKALNLTEDVDCCRPAILLFYVKTIALEKFEFFLAQATAS